jgi:hypothetical protein
LNNVPDESTWEKGEQERLLKNFERSLASPAGSLFYPAFSKLARLSSGNNEWDNSGWTATENDDKWTRDDTEELGKELILSAGDENPYLTFAALVIIDNYDDNWKDGKFRVHLGLIGYDFDKDKPYYIWSSDVSDNERFDMGYETIYALTLIGDISTSYKSSYNQPRESCLGGSSNLPKVIPIDIPIGSIINEPAQQALGLLRPYWEKIHRKNKIGRASCRERVCAYV